jgi:HrpA-like RNA helicase
LGGGAARPHARLPVEEHLEALLALTAAHRVVCFSGETGCGKSTVIPLALLRAAEAEAATIRSAGGSAPPCLVIVTQPRRIAAISLAQRVAATMGEPLGQTVGFAIGNELAVGAQTRLLFVTTGWLLHMASVPPRSGAAAGGSGGSSDGVLGRASHLILDEAHDRSLDADFLSLLIKRRLHTAAAAGGAARGLRLVVMSATLQGDLFRSYFASPTAPARQPGEYQSRSRQRLLAAAAAAAPAAAAPPPPMHVGVRRFPVREVYLDELSSLGITRQSLLFDASSECRDIDAVLAEKSRRKPRASPRLLDVAVLVAMHCARPGSTVLIFLPGSSEIECARAALAARAEGRAPVEAFTLHSLLPPELQAEALARPAPGVARVLLTTDIAESSLTLPDVTVVIDACLRRASCWNEAKGMSSLVTSFASHASCAQRAGRTGRVQPGTVVRLLSRASYGKLNSHDEPEILRSSLDDVILRAKHVLAAEAASQGVSSLLACALSPPAAEEVAGSLTRLALLGCVPPDDGDRGPLTALGSFAASLGRLPVPVARSLLLGCCLGAAADACILAAALTLDAPPFRQVMSLFAKSALALADDVGANTRWRAAVDGGRASDPIAWVGLYRMWACAPPGGWEASVAAGGPPAPFDPRAWRQLAGQLNPRGMRAFASAVRGLSRDLPRAARAAGVALSPDQLMALARLSAGPPRGAEPHCSGTSGSLPVLPLALHWQCAPPASARLYI